jgi:S-DNA-T family DNA segregation ATPase FtsK/SpoIIIE
MPEEVSNVAGRVGAFIAYHLVAAVGPAVWPLLAGLVVLCTMKSAGFKTTDLWLRSVGMLVLVASVAGAFSHLGTSIYGLPEGDGGVVGLTASHHLGQHFGIAGTRLVLLVGTIVGLLLVADELFVRWPMKLLAGFRSARERVAAARGEQEPVVVTVPAIGRPKMPTLPNVKMPSIPKFRLRFAKNAEDEGSEAKPVAEVDDDVVADVPEVHADFTDVVAQEDALEAEDEIDADEEPEAVETDVEEEPGPPRRDLSKIKVRLAKNNTPKQTAPSQQELDDYELPDWESLEDPETGFADQQEAFVRAKAEQLEEAFEEFGVDANVEAIDTGPVITMYEIAVAKGTKVSQVTGLSNDLARTLAAESIRIVAPIPGKNTIGIEVPNAEKEKVRLKDLMQQAPAKTQKMHIPIFLGKDSQGAPLIDDLARMPHCLIAGTTGSGKSVCINTIIMSILYTQRPDRVKLILVDPKVVEMAPFKDVPHLMCPVITEPAKAAGVLEWACTKMDERYELLAEAGVRNIAGYNSLDRDELIERMDPSTPEEEAKIPKHMPYVVVIIDELADLMMTGGKEVEASIVRIAQKARAVGIHLILATQRPQANVVTGLIKANMPSKIAFRVSSKMDSRIVLDQNGADLLLGQGDMLYLPPGAAKPMRSQGTFIDDAEIRLSVRKVKELAEAQYEPELVQIRNGINLDADEERDPLYEDAVRVVLETKRGSVSLLQRKLTIGYARASRIIEAMAADGIVGEYKGAQAREATLTLEEWEDLKAEQAGEEAVETYGDDEDIEAEYDEVDDEADVEEAEEDEPVRSEAA